MRCASIYRRANAYYLQSKSQTTAGIWLAGAPFVELSIGASNDALAHALRTVLSASQSGIEHPTDWTKQDYPLPSLGGAKSWAEFMKSAQGIAVTERDNTLQLTPYENRGPRQGYLRIEPPIELRADVDDATLAKGIDEAFSRCR